MKNFMKVAKYAGAALTAFVLLFSAATPAFAATLNNSSQDFATLRVKNNTLYPNSTTGWGSTVSASAGEEVSFSIYYHNTGPGTANNVRIRLSPQSTGNGTTHSFTAYVWADNASQVSGSATVYLTSSQSMAFRSGSVIWHANQSTYGSEPLLNGQNGSELFNSSGLLLGDIAEGWSTQGTFVLSFTVSTGGNNNPPPYQNLPSVTTYAPTNTSSNWAILNGYVNPNGTSNTTRWFEWGTQQYSLNNSTTKLGQGSSASNFSETVSSLSPNTYYYYRAVAQNSSGTVYGGIQSFYTTGDYYNPPGNNQQPFVSTSNATNVSNYSATLNCYVNPYNTYGTTRWFEWGTTQSLGNRTVTLSHGSTAGNASETVTGLSNNTTYYFRCVAQNQYGINYGTILSLYTGSGGNYGGNAPSAITNIATSVSTNSARLNGLGINLGGIYSDGWFEWGTTQSLGNTTSHISLGNVSSNTFYATISSLSPNTTYHFRAVVQNTNGTSRGDILNFRTDSAYVPPVVTPQTPTTPVVTKDATIVKSVSNLDTPNGTSQEVAARRGEKVRYTIEVRNTGTATIKEATIKDRIPYSVEFANAEGIARLDGTQREVVWFLGDFLPGQVRTVTLDVIVTNDAYTGSVIENVARLEGTNFSRTSNTANIRVTDVIGSTAGATALFGAGFLPNTFVGWLLLTILILILVIVARKAYVMFAEDTRKKNDYQEE